MKKLEYGGRKISYDPSKVKVTEMPSENKICINYIPKMIGDYPLIKAKIRGEIRYVEAIVVHQDGSVIGYSTDWVYNGVDETPEEYAEILIKPQGG